MFLLHSLCSQLGAWTPPRDLTRAVLCPPQEHLWHPARLRWCCLCVRARPSPSTFFSRDNFASAISRGPEARWQQGPPRDVHRHRGPGPPARVTLGRRQLQPRCRGCARVASRTLAAHVSAWLGNGTVMRHPRSGWQWRATRQPRRTCCCAGGWPRAVEPACLRTLRQPGTQPGAPVAGVCGQVAAVPCPATPTAWCGGCECHRTLRRGLYAKAAL